MTIGSVTATRKPMAPLTILDANGHRHTIQVTVDTGFTGELLLPEQYTRRFGLAAADYRDGRPATGEVIRIPAGAATVIWQGHQRLTQFLEMGVAPLLGMQFLWNHRITIDAVTNGAVTVTPLQSEPAPE